MATVLSTLVVNIAGDTTELQKSMRDAQRSMRRALGPEAMALSKGLVTAFAGVTAAAAGLGIIGIKLAADMEQTRIAFTTMLGSAEAARSLLDELQQFAAATPFEFPQLTTASRKLLAFGFTAKQIIPMLTSVGNAAAGLGLGSEGIDRMTIAIGQMQAKGKVSAQEMMQLAEAGVPAWRYLAQAIGVSIPEAMKMAEKGGIDAATGVNAILSGMNKDFGGMMEAQSKTMLGLWSTGKDNLSMILRSIGEDLIETFDLGPKMERAVAWLGKFADVVQRSGLRKALVELVPPGLQYAIGIVAFAIMGAMVPALVAMAIAAWAAIAPLWPFILAGAALGAVAVTIWRNWDTVKNVLLDVWGAIKYAAYNMVISVLGYLEKLTKFIPGLSRQVGDFKSKMEDLRNAEVATTVQRHLSEEATRGAEVAGMRYQAMADKAKESTDKMKDSTAAATPTFNNLGASMTKAATVTDIFTYKLDRLQKAWQLFTITTTLSESTQEYLIKQQENLQAQLSLVTDQMALTQASYEQSVSTTGLWSTATMDLGKAMDDLRIKQAELQKQIEETTKAAQHQGDIMRKDGQTYVNMGGAWVDINALGGAPARDQAEVEAIARRQGVDLGTAAAMYDANQSSGIKKYHTGGIFAAPPGRTEGLALLQDGETILPSGARAGVNVEKVEINVYGANDEQKTARIVRDQVYRTFQDLVRQGA